MLLTEVLTRLPGQRVVELTNAANSGGLRLTALAGTVTVTAGSLTVTGSGTVFVTGGLQGLVTTYGGVLVQFASQPGVNYVVASVASDTSLTLAYPYSSLTTAGVVASLPGVNYSVLQAAVYDAEQHFTTRTNFVYDDVTRNANVSNSNPTLNKCVWAGVSLVVAYLYDPGRGNPWPEAEVEAAWRTADTRLKWVLANYGDGAFSPPVTDSVFTPSVGPQRLPTFDNARFGDISPLAPGPFLQDGGGSSPTDWGGG